MRTIRNCLLTVLPATIALVGCNDPEARNRIRHREQHIQQTVRMLERDENERPEKLAGTLALLKSQNEHDIEMTHENSSTLRRWVDEDIKRWNERQPAYRAEIKKQLDGNPANIKRTLPDMVY